jgi:hypothetical protein
MVTIRRNEKLNGLEVAFDKKPSEAVLTYLKGNRFRWSKPGKVWYKTYSESLEKQIRDYFKDTEVESSDTPLPASGEIRKRIPMDEYFKSKRGPRKDIIIGEIEAGKMEYAIRKSFDGMTDSWNYHEVTNDSFKPAEEAIRTYNNGTTVNFVIEDLKSAIGQSHYLYSAHVGQDNEIGYYIDFEEYYIRYKDSSRKPSGKNVEDVLLGAGMKPDNGERDEPQYHVGDKVELRENYMTLLKSTMGTVVSTKMDEYNKEVVKILTGVNQSGQKIINSVPAEYLKKTEHAEALVDDDSKYYRVLNNDIILFKNKEAGEKVISRSPVLKTAYSVTFILEPSTEVDLGVRLPSGFYAIKPRDGHDNKLPFQALTKTVLDHFLNKDKIQPETESEQSFGEVDSFEYKSGENTVKYSLYNNKPMPDYITGEMEYFTIFNTVETSEKTYYDNYYGGFSSINEAQLELEYLRRKYQLNEDVKKPIAHNYGKTYEGLAESTAKSMMSQLDKSYQWELVPFKNKPGKFYIKGILKDINGESKTTIEEEDAQGKTVIKSVKRYHSDTISDAYDFVRHIQTYGYNVEFADGKLWFGNAVDKEEAKKFALQEIYLKLAPQESEIESAEEKAIGLITGSLVDKIKNNDYYFDYGQMNKETYHYLVAIIGDENADKLKNAGITILGAREMPGDDKSSPDPIAIAKAKAEALILILKLKNKNKEVPAPGIKAETLPVVKPDGVSFFEIYGIYPDALAIKYNEMVSEIKSYNIKDAYYRMTDQEILFENYEKFANDFINEIAKDGIKLKKPIELENGTIKLYRQPVNPLKKTGIESLAGVVLRKEDATSRPALAGVFVDDGKLIASDAYQMIIIKNDSESSNNGKIIDPKTGGVIVNAEYPAYKNIIPEYIDKTGEIDIDFLISLTNSAVISFKNIEDARPIMILDFDELDMGVNPIFLLHILQVLKANGTRIVTLEFMSPDRILVIKTDNENMALLMPITLGERLLVTERVSMKYLASYSKSLITTATPIAKTEPELSIGNIMTFEEFKANRPKSVIVEYLGSRGKSEYVTYTYKYYRYADRFGWYNRSGRKHISDKEAYDQYVYNLKSPKETPSFADKVIEAAESVGATVTYEQGGMISGPTLFDSLIEKKVIKLKEGGIVPVSQEWMGFYQNLKAANKKNIRTFADSIGVTNEYNEPLIKYLLSRNVPLIVISHEELKKKIIFRLTPPPESAIFYAQYMRIKGREIINIFMSILPKSMIGLGSWAISLGISLKEAIENTFVHECIHAYLMKEGFIDNAITFSRRLDLLRSEMNDYVLANQDKFSRIEKSASRIIAHPKSSPDELITYSFTMTKVANMLKKIPLKSGKTVWQELVSAVGDWDQNGILVMYAAKYGDVPALTLAMAKAKYKVYQGSINKIELGEGGIIVGPSHEEGGVDFIVRQTGQEVELEGEEAVIKKKVVKSHKKYNFEGKKVTPKEILNKLNTDGGGNPI